MTNATLARAWFLAVALYRSLGEFVSSLISIAEEIVRASFRGTVLALNRSLHGLTGPRRDGKVGVCARLRACVTFRSDLSDSHVSPSRELPRSSRPQKTVRRSDSDVFGSSSLNFLHGLDGVEPEQQQQQQQDDDRARAHAPRLPPSQNTSRSNTSNTRGISNTRDTRDISKTSNTRDTSKQAKPPRPPQALLHPTSKRRNDADSNVDTHRGLLEDAHHAIETIISVVFQSLQDIVSTVFALHTTSEKEERARRRQRKRLENRLRKWKKYYTFDAGDAIVKSGYPLQEFNVVTADGYHVQLQRIPNKGQQAVVFVHGVLDTSLTWVSQRIGSNRGSVAFAAYEAGLDVWLINTRANWPQRNDVRKKSEFWRFSANELALQDIAAQIAFVRRKKASEGDANVDVRAVGHSLGGACLLMYAVHKRLMGEEHHLDRLILLSPAGFHSKIPVPLVWAKYLFPALSGSLDAVAPSRGVGLGLRTPMLRFVIFKLLADVENHSVLREIFSVAFRAVFGNDASSWTTIVTMPHYNKRSMPMISLHLATHFAQWARSGTFGFFDGGVTWNEGRYGAPRPPSVAENYGLLKGLKIDVVGGTSDGLIPADMSYLHYVSLTESGVSTATYNEFDYGHLDFVMGGEGSAELGRFILDRLAGGVTNGAG